MRQKVNNILVWFIIDGIFQLTQVDIDVDNIF